MMSRAVHEAVYDSMEHAVSHGSTFAPNELAMAAGLATLHELDEQDLVEHTARLGEKLLELTRSRSSTSSRSCSDVRGLGLMWAIEFGEPDVGQHVVAADRADAARPLRAARRRAALLEAPHPEPGRRRTSWR